MEPQTADGLKIVPYQVPDPSSPRPRAGTKRRRRAQGGGPTKIGNACNLCRAKKTRCSGHVPCLRCREQSQVCQYMPTAASPGRSKDNAGGRDGESPRAQQAPAQDLSVACSPEDLHEDQYGHTHGHASEFAFLHYMKQKLASLPSMSIHFSDYPLVGSGKLPPVLPPRSVADGLVRNYFDFGLTTARFVHEGSLAGGLERLYGDRHCDQPAEDAAALLYMVLALGSHYSRHSNAFCGYASSVRFYDMAATQLQQTSIQITVTSVQARLLGIHYLLNHSQMHEAWSSFGIVVRHAQALGLHRKSTGRIGNHITHEYRKRLFWAIYINDRILSSIFGRPCAIHDDDVDQEECVLANDADMAASGFRLVEPGEFCSSAALLHYTKLAQILGTVLRTFYSPTASRSSISQLHEDATVVLLRLTQWQSSLPAYLNWTSLPPSALSTMAQRQICTLKLAFAHTSLLLHRPFILHALGSSGQSLHSLSAWLTTCHERSVEAAQLVVSECRYLCRHGLFSRAFWLVNYVQFAAIGTLYTCAHFWPGAHHVRDIAEGAMAEFPVGIEGDLVGQRYLEVLTELRDLTTGARVEDAAVEASMSLDGVPVLDDFELDLNGAWLNLFFDPAVMGGME